MPEEPVEEQWQACHGEVVNLGEGLRRRRRAQTLQRRAAITAGLMVFVLAGFFVVRNQTTGEPQYGGIVCHRVVELAESYLAGDLDEATAEQIRVHLEQCEPCRARIERMMQNAVTQHNPAAQMPSSDGHWMVAARF